MPLPALESLRHALIAAHCRPGPLLRRLALARYDIAWRAIDALPSRQRAELHQELYRLLPSDWPLWVERHRRQPKTGAVRVTVAA